MLTLQEAKAEAKKRWAVLGGWADYEDGLSRVGVRESTPDGTWKKVLGFGLTFEAAFSAADKYWARKKTRFERPPKPRKRKLRPGELPNVEMPL